MSKEKTVLLGVTGSIAAYKSAEIIRRLQDKGFKVLVAMTRSAEHFITPLTLSSLSGSSVYREMFSGQEGDWHMPHIELAKSADLFLIAPATANIIGKIASGIADDLLACVALATKAPIVVVPAMNTQMYRHKIVQENCRKLKRLGVHFVEPVKGNLVCGDVGQGHIATEDDIVKKVARLIK